MRWTYCHICDIEDGVMRKEGGIVQVYECHCCWNDYCDKHGSKHARICDDCLDDAYKKNKEVS